MLQAYNCSVPWEKACLLLEHGFKSSRDAWNDAFTKQSSKQLSTYRCKWDSTFFQWPAVDVRASCCGGQLKTSSMIFFCCSEKSYLPNWMKNEFSSLASHALSLVCSFDFPTLCPVIVYALPVLPGISSSEIILLFCFKDCLLWFFHQYSLWKLWPWICPSAWRLLFFVPEGFQMFWVPVAVIFWRSHLLGANACLLREIRWNQILLQFNYQLSCLLSYLSVLGDIVLFRTYSLSTNFI